MLIDQLESIAGSKDKTTVEKISDILSARLLEYENYPVPLGIPSTAVPRPVVGLVLSRS